MPLELTIAKIEEVDESLRGFYKADGDKFVLDVNGGAMPRSAFDAKVAEAEELKKLAYAEDGAAYKEKFTGSQNANKAIRQERDNFSSELKKWQTLGKLEEVNGWKDELDALKAKGENMSSLQQQIADLKKVNREYSTNIDALKANKLELENENASLKEYKTSMTKQLDMTDAEAKIAEVVEALKGANVKALKRNILDRYKDGTLKRDASGKIVTADDERSLADYAQETMEAYNLFLPTQGGMSLPTGGMGNQLGPKPNQQTTPEFLDSLFH